MRTRRSEATSGSPPRSEAVRLRATAFGAGPGVYGPLRVVAGGVSVLRQRTRPAVNRFAPTRAALLALLLLAAVPAAAQGKNFKVDGRVTGPPTVKGGAVTAPLQLTNRTARGLNLGTRRVNVRLSRRARLPLSGSGASASRLAPSGLQAGGRPRGGTPPSGEGRRRVRRP